MEKIFLLATSLLFFTITHAQAKRTKEGLNDNSGDTTWHTPSGSFKRQLVSNGRTAVHSEPGKYILYATYKSKKLTGYYAVDTKGNKLPVNTVARQSGGKFKCYACVKVCNEAGKCVESCTEDSCPDDMGVAKATTNERPKPEDPDQGGEISKKSGKKAKKATRKTGQ